MSSITINMNDAASMLNGLKALLPTLEKMVSATEPSLAAVTEKKRVGKPLTEEHKAKMKAGREAKKAEKAALATATATAPATAVAVVTEAEKPKRAGKPLTEEHKAKMMAGREAKQAEKAALATAVAAVTEAPSTATAVAEAEKPKRAGKPLTEEHKAKLKAGREAAKAKKEAEKAALATATATAVAAVTEAPSTATAVTEAEKPKRVGKPLTEEHKAKLKAGREAAKAKKEAEKTSLPVISEGEVSDSGSTGSKRGRPKGSKNKPKTEEEKAASKAKKLSKLELAASIPLPSSPVASPDDVISIKGRLFVVDSNNNAYTCIGTKERGEYVGRYDKNSQVIDDSLDAN